jgi:hypothetical protein
LSREYSGICVAQNTMLYATKGNLEVIVNYMYMDLSMLTGLEIWIDEGRPMDMCSICSVEQSVG